MPTYTFENEAGQTLEMNVPIGTSDVVQDGQHWTRTTTPEGFMVNTGAQMPDQRASMKRGYYQAEHKGWNSKFSKNQVKKIWNL